MATKPFHSPPDMLSWQFREIIAELQELARHASDSQCPCIQADSGEYCLFKHSLGLRTLADETAQMAPEHRDMLETLAEEALEHHNELKDRIVCGKAHDDEKDTVAWSRQWRKRLEPIYYACSVPAKKPQPALHMLALHRRETTPLPVPAPLLLHRREPTIGSFEDRLPLVDIGQLSEADRRRLQALKRRGEVITYDDYTFPKVKTGYALAIGNPNQKQYEELRSLISGTWTSAVPSIANEKAQELLLGLGQEDEDIAPLIISAANRYQAEHFFGVHNQRTVEEELQYMTGLVEMALHSEKAKLANLGWGQGWSGIVKAETPTLHRWEPMAILELNKRQKPAITCPGGICHARGGTLAT